MTIEKEVRMKSERHRIKKRELKKWKCVRKRGINVACIKKTKIMKVNIGSRKRRIKI
jgi:hypothetical protein